MKESLTPWLKTRAVCLTFFLLLCLSDLFPAFGKELSAVLYDNRNGLPTSEANAIVETSEGFIWVGSYSGLIRYDGNNFERIDSDTGIASVISLFVDSLGRLWVGTNDAGAAVWQNNNARIYSKADGLNSLSVHSIVQDGAGDIYLATTQGVAFVATDMSLTQLDESLINESYVRSLSKGADGFIYGLTKSGELFSIQGRKLSSFCTAQETGISGARAILPDPDKPGFIYLGNSGSQIYYGSLSDAGWKTEQVFTAAVSYINSLNIIDGKLWVCADTGTGYFADGKFIQLQELPMTTSVENIMPDYQGNLWFASSQQGVMKLSNNQFTDLFKECGLQDEVVYSTCMDKDRLFVGTKNSGLLVLQNGKPLDSLPINAFRTASGTALEGNDLIQILSGRRIRSIIKDSKNRLWFSTFGDMALLRYDGTTVTRFSSQDGLPYDRVRAIYECDNGSIIAACTGGVALIKGDEVTAVYGEQSGITNTEVLTVCQSQDGKIIAGTDGGGIYVIDKGSISHIGTEQGLSSEVIMRAKRSLSHDVIWLVTGNSISYMTRDSVVHTVRKFPYSNNFDLYENGSGELWVLSSDGVYIANVDRLIQDSDIIPLHYGIDNGLPCIATSNSYSFLTEQGDLYIAGMTGVALVNIRQTLEGLFDFKMAVPFISCDGKLIYPSDDGAFSIPSSARKLTVYGYVFNYSLTNPQMSYKLAGFDREENIIKRSQLAPVSYTNLKGGDYNFEMKLLDFQGKAVRSLDVKIIKRKALHEFVWVRIALLLLVAIAICTAVRLYIIHRTSSLLRKEKEQRQLTREIVEAFAKVIDMKDAYTNGHSSRVAEYTKMLARELGYGEDDVEKFYNIALLHDIGKIGIPSEILNKPGKLTDKEFNLIKSHSSLGYTALKDISIMPELAVGACAHHERPDGNGYPKGLDYASIPRVAQIITVADTFDAMYSDRPYRKRMNFAKAVSIMKEVRGTQLFPDVVDAFLRLVERGEFKAPDDHGGGTTEDINNIRNKYK